MKSNVSVYLRCTVLISSTSHCLTGGGKKKRKQKIEIVVYTNDSAVVGSGFLKLLNGRKSQQERNRIKIDQTENTIKDKEVKLIVRAEVHTLVHFCELTDTLNSI